MIEQFLSTEFFIGLTSKFDFLIQGLTSYLSGANNLKIISFALMFLALVLFLFLIVVIYVRNIIYFVKSNNPRKKLGTEDNNEDNINPFSEEEQQELEKELQRELDLALAERHENERKAEEQQLKKEQEQTRLRQEEQKEKKKKEEEKEEEDSVSSQFYDRSKEPIVDFDWQKGRIPPSEVISSPEISKAAMSYQQSRKELNQLIGLVIDMLGRGVDDLKIAQTLNYKNQGLQDENEILKVIDAVKNFISLCVSGKFSNLEKYAALPNEDQALYNLAKGDPSLALSLLENLMDINIDKANASGSEEKRQQIYAKVSTYACCFGALSELNDIMLATSAYELAIELLSTNVVAWSRLGDVYKKASSASKAAWAYQNVLNFAEGEIDIAEVANANRHLSEHLYAEGNSLQAAKLYNSAKQYYDSLGINRRLDKQELEIIEIIETNHQSSLPEAIQKLLHNNENIRN